MKVPRTPDVVGIGDALEAMNLTDHEIFRPQQLPRSQDLETVVHDAEAVGEATLGELVEGGRFRAGQRRVVCQNCRHADVSGADARVTAALSILWRRPCHALLVLAWRGML